MADGAAGRRALVTTSACPPYEGVGRIDIELVSAGPNRPEVAAALRERLGAAERDAISWIDHAPCMVKRGAMRDDAIRLSSAIEPLGAQVTMHGFTWSTEAPSKGRAKTSAAAKKPWWKIW